MRRPLISAFFVITIASSPILHSRNKAETARTITNYWSSHSWKLPTLTPIDTTDHDGMVTVGLISPPRQHPGNPPCDRRLDGKLSRKRSGRAYSFGVLSGNWVSTGTPRRSMLKPTVLPQTFPKQELANTLVTELQSTRRIFSLNIDIDVLKS